MAAPITGQVAITATAQALSAAQVNCVAYTIKTPSTNTKPVYIGSSTVTTGTGFVMEPGDEFTYERKQQSGQSAYPLAPSDVYAVGTVGDVLTWFASPAVS